VLGADHAPALLDVLLEVVRETPSEDAPTAFSQLRSDILLLVMPEVFLA
jgi:hypothetical protein